MSRLHRKINHLHLAGAFGVSVLTGLAGCASNPPESQEYADAEQRIQEIRRQQQKRYQQYEYNNMPGLAIEFQVFNNAFRAIPDEPLGYYEDFEERVYEEEIEDPIKREEEAALRAEEALKNDDAATPE